MEQPRATDVGLYPTLEYALHNCGPSVNRWINFIEWKTGQRRVSIFIGLVFIIALYLAVGTHAPIVCNSIMFFVPAYLSLRNIELSTKDEDCRHLVYWLLYGLLGLPELYGDVVRRHFKLFWLFKFVFLLWCILPIASNGVTFIYFKILQPIFLSSRDGSPNYEHRNDAPTSDSTLGLGRGQRPSSNRTASAQQPLLDQRQLDSTISRNQSGRRKSTIGLQTPDKIPDSSNMPDNKPNKHDNKPDRKSDNKSNKPDSTSDSKSDNKPNKPDSTSDSKPSTPDRKSDHKSDHKSDKSDKLDTSLGSSSDNKPNIMPATQASDKPDSNAPKSSPPKPAGKESDKRKQQGDKPDGHAMPNDLPKSKSDNARPPANKLDLGPSSANHAPLVGRPGPIKDVSSLLKAAARQELKSLPTDKASQTDLAEPTPGPSGVKTAIRHHTPMCAHKETQSSLTDIHVLPSTSSLLPSQAPPPAPSYPAQSSYYPGYGYSSSKTSSSYFDPEGDNKSNANSISLLQRMLQPFYNLAATQAYWNYINSMSNQPSYVLLPSPSYTGYVPYPYPYPYPYTGGYPASYPNPPPSPPPPYGYPGGSAMSTLPHPSASAHEFPSLYASQAGRPPALEPAFSESQPIPKGERTFRRYRRNTESFCEDDVLDGSFFQDTSEVTDKQATEKDNKSKKKSTKEKKDDGKEDKKKSKKKEDKPEKKEKGKEEKKKGEKDRKEGEEKKDTVDDDKADKAEKKGDKKGKGPTDKTGTAESKPSEKEVANKGDDKDKEKEK